MGGSCGIQLRLRKDQRASFKKEDEPVLGFKNISLLFNLGPAEGGSNLILAETDGDLTTINSNDLVHDLPAYELSEKRRAMALRK